MGDKDGMQGFCHRFDVSRETLDRLEAYATLLQKWSGTINLVSKNSLTDLWTRHFLDSAQIFTLKNKEVGHWVDIGSGGGFPGMVCATLAAQLAPKMRFTLVESDKRKAVFLQTVNRMLALNVTVLSDRIEELSPLKAEVLSARALAPLSSLLEHAEIHLKENGQALFMKGASFRRERDEALETWQFQSDEYPSITDSAAVILSLGDIKRV